MPLSNQDFTASFGVGFTGLAGTVGYQLRDSAGVAVGARVTAGITEPDAGSGVYRVTVASVADSVASITWDTGGGSPVFAVEDVGPYHQGAAILADTSTMEPLVSTNLDATVSSRATQADILSDATPFQGADVAAILADTSTMEPLVSTNLDATVSSRSSHTPADVDTQLSGTHGAGNWETATAASVWDEPLADHLTAGTTGEALLRARSSEALHVRLSVDPGAAVPLNVDPGLHVELGDE